MNHITHLAALFGSITSCGKWSKFTTLNAASVTCPDCCETWDYAVALRRAARTRKPAA